MSRRSGEGDLVSPLREQLKLSAVRRAQLQTDRRRRGGRICDRRCRSSPRLLWRGQALLEMHDPDPLAQAGLRTRRSRLLHRSPPRAEPRSANTYFYRGFRYESAASRQLAELLVELAAARLGLRNAGAHGMAEVILRRTAMPAVLLELGAPRQVAMKTAGSRTPSRMPSNGG